MRKPRKYEILQYFLKIEGKFIDAYDLCEKYDQSLNIKSIKRFHKWLGSAIKYLESKESPKDGAAGKDKE